jgi:hypothetical protein
MLLPFFMVVTKLNKGRERPMHSIESWFRSVRMAGRVDRPRRGRRYHRSSSCVATKSVGFAAALGCRNSGCTDSGRRAASKSIALRPTLLFAVALTWWRIWNFRQAPARVNLLVGRTLRWRRAIGHRNPPRTFEPGFRCLASDGLRWLFWVARLSARHRSHSFDYIITIAAAARSGQSSNAVRAGTRAAMIGGLGSPCASDDRMFSARTDRTLLTVPAKGGPS